MSLGIYLIPIFVTGSIYLFRSTKDFIQNKKITMSDPKNNLNSLKKESEKSLEVSKNSINKEKINEGFHLNSLITKNISLFTKNPNYKMLAWLIVQLIIFSLFVFAVNIFKNNLIPYFNTWEF